MAVELKRKKIKEGEIEFMNDNALESNKLNN